MAVNTLKCNHLMPLPFKGLRCVRVRAQWRSQGGGGQDATPHSGVNCQWWSLHGHIVVMMMMKLPILPCAEKLELVLSTATKT